MSRGRADGSGGGRGEHGTQAYSMSRPAPLGQPAPRTQLYAFRRLLHPDVPYTYIFNNEDMEGSSVRMFGPPKVRCAGLSGGPPSKRPLGPPAPCRRLRATQLQAPPARVHGPCCPVCARAMVPHAAGHPNSLAEHDPLPRCPPRLRI